MKKKKQLKELTIRDNFMFGAVMMEEENCRRFLELALDFPIERVDVSKEKSIVYHPEYKGVRLDVYAKDEKNTRYNVEMQVAIQSCLMSVCCLSAILIPLGRKSTAIPLQDAVKKYQI